MAFTTGTATDFHDLLNKLRLYLVAQGWTQLAWVAPATLADQAILHVRGPGAGAGKQVFASIRSSSDAVAGFYSWDMRMAVNYDGAVPWGSQLSQSPSEVYFNTWQNAMNYWFFVNDRRFVVVAKCSTNYMSMHMGFFLPWGTPAQYPFPLCVAGDFFEKQPHSYNYASRRMFVDPGRYDTNPYGDQRATMHVRTPGGDWYPTGNHGRSSFNNLPTGVSKGPGCVMWPYHPGYGGGGGVAAFESSRWGGGSGSGSQSSGFETIVPTQQGERALMPCMIIPGDQAPLGVLDGVYAVGGSGLVTEQQITIGARTFRVFQNIARNSPDDFFCVEEI